MRWLKVKFFFYKHRKFIYPLISLLFIVCTIIVVQKINFKSISQNSTMIGTLSTLLGALIGGVLSLLGSIWVNSKQQKAIQNIRRKKVIYSPLYDELVDIQKNILKNNPFPNYVTFEKRPQTMLPYPQFTAWNRIKSDTRYLEVPNTLLIQMEKLEESIKEYTAIRNKANDEAKQILNDVLLKNGCSPCSIINIGDCISSKLLLGKNDDFYQEAMLCKNNEINQQLRDKINNQILENSKKSQIIKDVQKKYNKWISEQQKSIDLLALLIKHVLQKYEG